MLMMTDDPKYFIVWPVCSGAGQTDLLDHFTIIITEVYCNIVVNTRTHTESSQYCEQCHSQ